MNNIKSYLGLGKTLFNSSIAHLLDVDGTLDVEHLITERHTRNKSSGAWPEHILKMISSKINYHSLIISENRDVADTLEYEDSLNKNFPFYEHLERQGLGLFTRRNNSSIQNVSHHLCHAYAALALSPFEKSIILVIDGAGSSYNSYLKDLDPDTFNANMMENSKNYEEVSIYLQNGSTLKPVFKKWQQFSPSTLFKNQKISDGIGIFYETIAQYIFNSKRAAGKVMGLANFGSPLKVNTRGDFLQSLDPELAFRGKSKEEWEHVSCMKHYENIAATAQSEYELYLAEIFEFIKVNYPEYDNLIYTGGSALNCTFNMKAYNKRMFKNIYIPPFPGDECISFGLAYKSLYSRNPELWSPVSLKDQQGYFGSKDSVPTKDEILKTFVDYNVTESKCIAQEAANILKGGKIIAWFQGRSESGPRALGNRSILCKVDRHGIKEHLNKQIKFRESFRPYGCSVLFEHAHDYFNIDPGFNNPFMSFAPTVRTEYQEIFRQVMHIDQTSRMQTVREGQNARFYNLLKTYGEMTGTYALLNTSLNIMGEPIVETVHDAKKFFDTVNVDALVIEDFIVQRSHSKG